MDTLTRAERSERMSRVRSKDTKPELLVRRLVHGMGFRYRLHVSGLPGSPDLVFPSCGKIIFVHRCFWHRTRDVRVQDGPTPGWISGNRSAWREQLNLMEDRLQQKLFDFVTKVADDDWGLSRAELVLEARTLLGRTYSPDEDEDSHR